MKKHLKRVYISLMMCIHRLEDRVCNFLDRRFLTIDYSALKELPIAGVQKICVVVPHIDDDILGMGATLHRLDQLGIQTKIIYTTDGCKSYHPQMNEDQMADARAQEAEQVCSRFEHIQIALLKCKSMQWDPIELAPEVCKEIEIWKPDAIFFPNIFDRNLDHVKNGLCISACAEHLGENVEYYMYPVQTPIAQKDLTHYQAVTESDLCAKERCLSLYSSQYVMDGSFAKVVLYNRLSGRGMSKDGAEVFEYLTCEHVKQLKEETEEFYHRDLPSLRYRKRISKSL